MERLGDILKKRRTETDSSKESTDIWSTDDLTEEEKAANQCPICHGAKYVYPLLSNGKPDYKRRVPCVCASDEKGKERLSRLQKFSNLGSLSRLNFENLTAEGRKIKNKVLFDFEPAYNSALEFAKSPKGWLILTGQSGSGKTHLACAIANYQITMAKPVFYIEVAELLDHIYATFNANSDLTYNELFEQVKSIPLLILDDLDLSINSAWAKGKIQQILNHRFNEQLPTLITSSVPAEILEDNLNAHLTDPEFCVINKIQSKEKLGLEHFDGMQLELMRKMSFKNFDYKRLTLSYEQKLNLEQAYRVALNFAQSPQGWLILAGDNGCGKTHLAASIANHLLENNKQVLFVVVPDFLDYLRSAYNPDSRISYDEVFEKVKKAPVLILDDFGEQDITPWTQEKLYQLINYRYNARLATVITTCFALDEIESRISSRMVDTSLSMLFNIDAPDYRGERKKTGKKQPSGLRKTARNRDPELS
jgi:DNA replication protein DnaC